MNKINLILEKLPKILEKVNKYANLSLEIEDVKKLAIYGFIALVFLFFYFSRTWSFTKDNFIKWDNFSFLKLSLYMIIPIVSIFYLNKEIISNPILNNWVHFFIMFLIIPIIPYFILCIYRIIFVIIKTGTLSIYSFFYNKKVKQAK